MKLARMISASDPGNYARFEAEVRARFAGAVRQKTSGCRTGHFVVRDEAVGAFERLAATCGVELDVYDPSELERSGRRSRP